ncbi:MAG: PepSY-like domain-containing protein, partial [Muribaculaceae bacterium]|nr:PepSY-like domain-containing protein [Muribaculaceae bacterium]
MKKLLLMLLLLLGGAGVASAFVDSYVINRENLPEAARQMLSEYFPKAKVSLIKVDRHLLKKTDYDVKLVNGTKIEFNNAGKWKSVDCKTRAVPEGLISNPIRKYVDKNFPG